LVRFDAYSASNSIGSGHSENQDSYLVDVSTLLFAVADGVGGYQGGKEAAELATSALRNKAGMLRDESTMRASIEDIHEQLKETAKSMHYPGMGTTLAAAKVLPSSQNSGRVITANAGDSPILLYPRATLEGTDSGEFQKLYTDDSYRDRTPASMWAIVQYLGIESHKLEVHTQSVDYSVGDVILICSDGITDNLLNPGSYAQRRSANIGEIIRKFGSAKKIVEEAISVGTKPDDMTAVLIFL